MKESIENKVLSILSNSKPTSIKFIAQKLYISESTARRYVNALAKNGLVIRTHGGCVPCAKAYDNNSPVFLRFDSGNEIKSEIAKCAMQFVKDGDTIFLDSSSTVYHLIPFLRNKNNLTVVTSGLKTATSLAEHNVKTICLGGLVSYKNLSANSTYAIELIRSINADVFFFSSDGIDEDGNITDNSFEECVLRKAFIKQAKFKVLLIDDSKLLVKCKYNLCSINEIDKVISNNQQEIISLK